MHSLLIFQMAHYYNQTLAPSRLADPFTEEEERGRAEYARMLEIEEKIGFIEIPKISQNIPVLAGTSDSVLQRYAGHLEGTSLPVGGESTIYKRYWPTRWTRSWSLNRPILSQYL